MPRVQGARHGGRRRVDREDLVARPWCGRTGRCPRRPRPGATWPRARRGWACRGRFARCARSHQVTDGAATARKRLATPEVRTRSRRAGGGVPAALSRPRWMGKTAGRPPLSGGQDDERHSPAEPGPGRPPPSRRSTPPRTAWCGSSARPAAAARGCCACSASLDAVVPIDDPHLGHHLGVWRPISLAWATAEHPPDLTTLDRVKHDKDSYFFSDRYRDAWAPALRRLIVDRFDAQVADTARVPDPLVVVKEPGSHVADQLCRLFPGSRLVFLLRDGRDVVDSWLAAYRAGSWALDEGAFPVTDRGARRSCAGSRRCGRSAPTSCSGPTSAHPPDRRVMIRYEDLVADPCAELTRICAPPSRSTSRPTGWRRWPTSTPTRRCRQRTRASARRSGRRRRAGGATT